MEFGMFHEFPSMRGMVPMKLLNFEFKACLRDAPYVRATLKHLRARFLGMDHQVDTYFRIPSGRLKIREGRLENSLIFYKRSNSARPRRSTRCLRRAARTGFQRMMVW